MDELSGVDPADPLTGLVGLVARSSATLEMLLHELLRELDSGGDDWRQHEKFDKVGDLVKKCRSRIEDPTGLLPDRLAPLAALDAADRVNKERHAVIHGAWTRVDAERLWSSRYSKRDLGLVIIEFTEEQLHELVQRLLRSCVQVAALRHLVYDKLTGAETELDDDWERQVQESEALVRGEFDLVGLNHYRLVHPSTAHTEM